jgi:hypothetical protein
MNIKNLFKKRNCHGGKTDCSALVNFLTAKIEEASFRAQVAANRKRNLDLAEQLGRLFAFREVAYRIEALGTSNDKGSGAQPAGKVFWRDKNLKK